MPTDLPDAQPRHKWQTLVDLMATEGLDVPEAAERAGFSDSSSAYRALKQSHVQEALIEAYRDQLKTLGGNALRTLDALARTSRSDKVKLEAANSILDRLGLTPPERTVGAVTVGEVNILVNLGQTGGEGEKLGVSTGHPHPLANFPAKPEGSPSVIEDAQPITEDDE